MSFGGLVDHLIHGQRGKVAKHNIDNGTHPGDGRADADAGHPGFRDGRVDHPLGAKFIDQAQQHLERCTGLGHIFADDKDPRVAAHLFGNGFFDCFAIGHDARGLTVIKRRHVDRPPLGQGTGHSAQIRRLP